MNKINLLLIILLWSINSIAQIPVGYYNTATGTGYTLKTQLYNKIKNHTDHGYGGLWITYATSDRDNQYENDNTIFDLYSESPTGPDPVNFYYSTNQCGNFNSQGDCYNREHVVPQSIFNSASPMVSDAHFIIPTDGYVNFQRDNFPHGKVGTTSWTSLNGSKRGSSNVSGYTGTVFEPLDDFKGDIARMYLYFATRYENLVANYSTYPMFNGTSNQVFTSSFLTMLLSWHNQDPVSAREIARNNAIYARQNNRNPFIDHPEYAGYIWGGTSTPSSQTIIFNPLANVEFGSTPLTLSATASSGLTISYISSNTNVATVFGNTVTIVGLGTTTITASQLGNASYNAATPISQTLTVTQASQTINFNALANKVIGDVPFTIVASGGASGNPIIFTSSNPSVATIAGNLVSIVGVGITTITASQAGNANYLNAVNVTNSLTVTNGIIAAWDFHNLPGGTGANNFGVSPLMANFVVPNVNVSGITRGAGIGASTTQNAAARAWGGTVNTATAASALSSNATITCTLNTPVGYAMDLNGINPIDYRRSSSGATNALVQYSVNGSTFFDIATLNFTNATSGGASAGSINLSAIAALQNIHASQTVTIRILPYGGTGGTFYFFDRLNTTANDLSILGNIRICNPSISSESLTISSSLTPFLWHGQSLSTTGVYNTTLINSLGCDSIVTLNLTVQPSNVSLQVKAFLQAYYNGSSSMKSVLYNQGESINTFLCDTVLVELHNNVNPYVTMFATQGMLQTNGLLNVSFPSSTIGNEYYVVLKHRNSIETWSANPLLISSVSSYDFSNAANKAFGNNEIEVEPNVWAFYCGDMNQDGVVEISDYILWETDANNFTSGYINSDLDGNGSTDISDYVFWETNANIFIGIATP